MGRGDGNSDGGRESEGISQKLVRDSGACFVLGNGGGDGDPGGVSGGEGGAGDGRGDGRW